MMPEVNNVYESKIEGDMGETLYGVQAALDAGIFPGGTIQQNQFIRSQI